MQLRWVKGLPEKDKGVMKARIMESHDVLAQLTVLLNEDLTKSYADMAATSSYERPAWAEYQASKLGEQKYIRKIIELLNIEE